MKKIKFVSVTGPSNILKDSPFPVKNCLPPINVLPSEKTRLKPTRYQTRETRGITQKTWKALEMEFLKRTKPEYRKAIPKHMAKTNSVEKVNQRWFARLNLSS